MEAGELRKGVFYRQGSGGLFHEHPGSQATEEELGHKRR